MRGIQTLFAAFSVCLLAAGLVALRPGHAGENIHPLAVELAFDRPINASVAPLVVAMTDGLFSSEGLAVTSNISAGSPEAIARVASGASEFAFVDINALIRFRSQASPALKAVFVLFNKSPYAIVARKSRGIHVLSDIE